MATNIKGKLENAALTDFSGYRIAVEFEQKVDLGTSEPAYMINRVETFAAQAGDFALEIPDANERKGKLLFTATDPAGLPAGDLQLPEAGPFTGLVITVGTPAQTDVTESTDPALGAQIKYTGRVIDPSGRGLPANLLLVLWAQTFNGTDPVPVSTAFTSSGGYFSGVWPTEAFELAFAVVSGGKPIPVALEANRIPIRLILVAPEIVAGEDPESDCNCKDAPPRSPDGIDLGANPSAYSKDTERCVDFTIPNRTVEEVTYQAVVRTTQPEIKGNKPRDARPVPGALVNRLAELARLKPEDFRTVEFANPAPVASNEIQSAALRRTAKTAGASLNLLNLDKASAKVVESVFSKAMTIAPGIDLEGNWLAEAESDDERAKLVLETRIQNKTPLFIEPGVLSELAKESGELTPRRLLEAEQTSVVRQFRTRVGLLAGAPPARFVLDHQRQLEWDEMPDTCQATTIAHGHLLTLKQVWRADGYSLGDLLYSLPLAPGQQKRISVLDWNREEVASRRASIRAEEGLTAELSHDRDVEDIIRTTLSEHMQARSHADTESVGGGIAGFIGGFVFGAAGGVSSAGSTASQTSARAVTGLALNSVRDRTAQSASAVRSQRATVVQQNRQSETVRAQTEVVANYNHCHAMTVEYFEVLRHFQVSQELAHVQECLFIPFAITPFNQQKASRWRESLVKFLRKRTLHTAFDALDRVRTNWQDADYPPNRYADDAMEYFSGELVVKMRLPRPADGGAGEFVAENWKPYADNGLLWDSAQNIWDRYMGTALVPDRDAVWDQQLAPGIAQRLLGTMKITFISTSNTEIVKDLDTTLVSRYSQDRPLQVSLRVPLTGGFWTRAQVRAVRLAIGTSTAVGLPKGAGVLVESASMDYRTAYFNHQMFKNHRILNDLNPADAVEIATPLDAAEKSNPRERDRRLTRRLIDHLNEHVEFYHRAIWLTMDPNRRYLLLDGFLAPDAQGRSVASVVENRVIGIVGNSMVMPVAPGMEFDPTYRFSDSNLTDLRHLYSADPTPPLRVSVPTSGVFAEAVLGKCNSCEVIDDTRFWRWEEAPIPDQPTAIAPLSLASRRGTLPSLRPDAFPESLVRFQEVPDAPAPSGLAAAVNALGANNIFKDLTGLALNQENAAEALKTSIKVAQEFASKAGQLAQQRFLNKGFDRTLDQIKAARDKGLITPEQAQARTESLFRGALGEKRQNAKSATSSPEVQRAMDRVSKATKGFFKINRPEGSVEVSTDNSGSAQRINFSIDPSVAPVKQPSNMTCWAAGATMMVSWRENASLSIETVLDQAGGEWRAKFERNEGLTAVEIRSFFAAFNLVEEGPQSYTPEGLARLLANKGALLEIGDDSIDNNFVVHVRIITGMQGDGTAEGTTVTLADSASGTVITEPFTEFDRRHGSTDAVRFGVGLFHF